MENRQQRWNDCLRLIRENIKNDADGWVYNTWFLPVTCEQYDESSNTVLLQVPSTYVYEFLEHYYVRLLSWALSRAFKPGVRLQYRVAPSASPMPAGFLTSSSPQRMQFAVPDARHQLEMELKRVVGPDYQWLPPYDKVADWLSDNKGRGLLFVGTPGIGKSRICKHILPVIIGGKDHDKIPVVSAQEMNARVDELLKARCVVIDDLGKEPVEHVYNFGRRRKPFFELCDASEQGGPLLIITTNLSTTTVSDPHYPMSIEKRYGPEVLDRLCTITTTAIYTGPSLRH